MADTITGQDTVKVALLTNTNAVISEALVNATDIDSAEANIAANTADIATNTSAISALSAGSGITVTSSDTTVGVAEDKLLAGTGLDATVGNPSGDETYTFALSDDAGAITTKITSTTYTIGTTDPAEAYGGVIYVTGNCTITIPAVTAGMNFCVVTLGAYTVSVKANASDLIYLDGTALDDGDKITNTATTGDMATFFYYNATGWVAITDGWSDGGA